jgi:hypothetical protein
MRMRKIIRFHPVVALAVVAGLVWLGCGGCESKAGTGALVGGAAGAGVGQLVGRNTTGTVIGGAVGAGAGYLIGREADKRASPPPADRPPDVREGDVVTVNVTNSNGSVTPVRLTRQGSGYVGPKGEYYSSLPTPEQLRQVYGF